MKVIRKALAALLIAACLIVPAAALEPIDMEPTPIGSGTVSPCAEEVCWYFRELNGKYQRRLWSITYGRWLTDWIDCN